MDAGSKGWAKDTAPLNEVEGNGKYIGGVECGRCGGSVYEAEKRAAAGLVSIDQMFPQRFVGPALLDAGRRVLHPM